MSTSMKSKTLWGSLTSHFCLYYQNCEVNSYLSLVNSDGPTNAAGLPTHLIAFAVHLGCITGSVITYFNMNIRQILSLSHTHTTQNTEHILTLSSISVRCAFSLFSLRRIFSMSHWSSSISTCSSLTRWSALLAARPRGRDWTRQKEYGET